ncbi:pickpocket protein 19-like [Schistocerca cancellata]|uniref:pickpocket protein 19-like n=1 Tax=Schistocerca cancellata TaxID=274614 RepID=UPI002117BD3A|nr:pickpocket protein 19-like [Schistocerca cancellata]
MRVESTHWPLRALPFPAVTVCPGRRVVARLALPLLARELGEDPESLNGSLQESLLHVLSALSLFRSPSYEGVARDLLAAGDPLLRRLAGLNVTSLMLQVGTDQLAERAESSAATRRQLSSPVLPRCEAVFHKCFFEGAPLNCCREMSLQRAPVGFCYSFNSLTSEARRHCDAKDARLECAVRRGAGSGDATGLELFLRRDAATPDGVRRLDPPGARVTVHGPRDTPGPGLVAPQWPAGGARTVTALSVDAAFITSEEELRRLPLLKRLCLFPDERPLLFSRFYTRANCIHECLQAAHAKKCGCLPYISRVPSVKVVTSGNKALERWLATGETRLPEALPQRCGRCLPDCQEAVYSARPAVARDSNPAGATAAAAAYVDVHFSQPYAIKYRRVLTFDTRQLLVSLGGIASLFLGVSLLTVAELLYWAARIAAATAAAVRRRSPGASPAPPSADNPCTTRGACTRPAVW